MCVLPLRGEVVLAGRQDDSGGGFELHVHSLHDGRQLRRVGTKGSDKGQLNFWFGGLCATRSGDSVLVADAYNNRVQVMATHLHPGRHAVMLGPHATGPAVVGHAALCPV
jgi:hypothetical protein